MAIDHYSTMGMDSRKESDRLLPRTLFFSAVLLMSHVLEIEPSSFDAGGIKIAVTDVSVIHGGLALVALYYLWMAIANGIQGNILLPFDHKRVMLRYLIRNSAKPYVHEGFKTKTTKRRGIAEVKKSVWWTMFAYNLFIGPFAIVIFAIIISAAVIGVLDVIDLASFIFEKLVEV